MFRSWGASSNSAPGASWPPHESVASTLSAENGWRKLLDVVGASQDSDPLVQVHRPWATLLFRVDRAMGPFSPPSEQRTASRARRGSRTGTSSRKSLRFASRPPRFRACPPSLPPLSFAGSRKPGFVGFYDAAFLPGRKTGRQGPKPVPPQKGGFGIDPASSGRFPDRTPR